MNIINKLTLRQLMLNKKRTLVTIIGAVISAAMITAVATLGLSFVDLMQRQCIADNGEWHVGYSHVNDKQLEAIQKDKETKATILTKDIGYAYLEGSKNENKPYLFIKNLNKEGFKYLPIELREGRLPEKQNELVISEAILSNAKVNYKIGDVLNLQIGQRYYLDEEISKEALMQDTSLQKDMGKLTEVLKVEGTNTYTIVGIIKRPNFEMTWAPGYTVISYIDEDIVKSGETTDVLVVVNKVKQSIFKHAEKLAKDNGIDKPGFNNDLLRYYGVVNADSMRKVLFILSAIIMFIIMVGSISLIYNAFAISVSERSKYLGMLSSIGATKKQKRNSVFFEGAVIGSISIPLGLAAGLFGIWVTFQCINPVIKGALGVTETFQVVINPFALLTAVLVSVATILISTYIPARKASRVTAIDAIRQTQDVKFNQKSIRTFGITRKLFGMEGDLGLKNLKRNRGRYKATVFSLIISMLLYLVVTYFTDNLKQSVTMTQDGVNFDIRVSFDSENKEAGDQLFQKIKSLDNVTKSTIINSFDVDTWIKEADIADYLKTNKDDFLKDGKYPYTVTVNVLEEKELQNYAKEIGVDYNSLKDSKNPSAVVIDTVKYRDNEKQKFLEKKIWKTKTGEAIQLSYRNPDTGKEKDLSTIKIASLTSIMPMGIMTLGKAASFHIIISKEVYQKLVEGTDIENKISGKKIYLNSDEPLKLQENIEEIGESTTDGNINIFNVYIFKQREEQMILLLSVFTYAFIFLITAICIANILNTISTSIALRKREFAMLKSVGITPKGFNKMLRFESIFYGIKALLYGIPISIGAMYLMHGGLTYAFVYPFEIPWSNIIIAVISVFLIVGMSMLYSSSKVKKENIIDALKQEII